MDNLEYQLRLAEYDVEIQKSKIITQDLEWRRAKFVSEVLSATLAKKKSEIPGGISVTKGPV